jgi:transposase-like protein
VDDLVKALGGSGISKSQVSRLVEEIDERVDAFLSRPIEGEWPYVWIDATYLKARQGGRIASTATILAVGVNTDGRREVLGVATGPSEAETFWKGFLRSLADRGLRGVKLVIADDHKGLRAAASKVFAAGLQRCKVHWLRNALAHVGAKQRPAVAAMLKTIFAQETAKEAHDQWNAVAGPRGRSGLHRVPQGPLDPDRQHQSARAAQQGDQAAKRRRRDLPQRAIHHPPGRRPHARTERRVGRQPTVHEP